MTAPMHDFILCLKPVFNIPPMLKPTPFEQFIGTPGDHSVDFTPSVSQKLGRDKLYDYVFLTFLNCRFFFHRRFLLPVYFADPRETSVSVWCRDSRGSPQLWSNLLESPRRTVGPARRESGRQRDGMTGGEMNRSRL